ncbi:3-methyl-2-oxobutanoate hydroxymethyltransferase [Enterovirga rhinocerotis]|uniref:3-methyl-2-oxobutanoate hydroxymethyltransferase n=1 Tax=Enterovirga rhinocerotis TaxID=1339210 RepID=A0A4R7BRB8_9HYPH|nr:3-methyl-2-oxobutanoate hydroxymethyltransferase [Enterovirga rhinocerotis]TDR88224.1 ketopantoate hydroxymethyltransferase [Enterovirga rhinocerotis]
MPFTIQDLQRRKQAGERVAMVTAYDYPSALLVGRAGIPMILVGDSMGMVVHGHGTTLPVTVEDIVRHTAAVVRAGTDALIVADLPFLTYSDPESAVAAARRIMQDGGAHAVKLEGGAAVAPIVRHLVAFGVPVMGHLGFTPQAQHQIGIRAQGKEASAARRMLDDALLLQEAGAFSVVLELVPAPLAAEITARLGIPTIGIGAGLGCDGQVQVWHDLLGLFESKPPRHAKPYAKVGALIEEALRSYREEVEAEAFPTAAQSVKMDEAALAEALR